MKFKKQDRVKSIYNKFEGDIIACSYYVTGLSLYLVKSEDTEVWIREEDLELKEN